MWPPVGCPSACPGRLNLHLHKHYHVAPYSVPKCQTQQSLVLPSTPPLPPFFFVSSLAMLA